jgi:hypothetical protein
VRRMKNCVVLIGLAAASAAFFVSLRPGLPGLAAASAQEARGRQPAGAPASKSNKSATERIEAELVKETSVDFVESPLKDVVTFLSEHHQIPIVLSVKKLEEASVSPDTPVTKTLRGIQLGSALRLILRDLELTYLVRDEVLQITTPEDAESQLLIHVFDCRDLLAMQGGERDLRPDRLMDLITTNVNHDSWREVGGPGAISEYNGLVVVTQTAETQKEIERLLDMLRKAAGLEAEPGARVVR